MIWIIWPFPVFSFQFVSGWLLLCCFLNLISFLRRGKPRKEMEGTPHSEPAVLEGWSWLSGAQWRAVCCCAVALPASGKMQIPADVRNYPQQACRSHKSSLICLITEDYLSFVSQWLLKKHLVVKLVFVIPQLAKHAYAECSISQLESRASSSPSTDLGLACFTTDHKSVGKVLKKIFDLFGLNNLSTARM